ncbi:FAD binding domain-containing protein [Sphaerisporangium perillae]|uniref:FAD binding domain-containing protein n=1 Tax=Sphaerisporangium perillae TaxID=2935860 RepID=UPI00201055DA|nr:xanthine dehydrogenase family protein subunit M [Sphaerisporangium perillae]
MKPAAFTYHRARDVAGAIRLLAELGDEAKIIAGGQSLVAMMNYRLARPAHLVDIGRIGGLDHLRGDGSTLRIGALTTHHAVEVATDAWLGRGFTLLRDAMAWVGHLPIRTRGTVGGSLAHADATAEWCLLAVLLDAEIVASGPRGTRTIAAGDFFHGFYTTALAADEMITEVVFPRPAPHSALLEFAERRGDFAIVSAAVDLDVDEHRAGRAVRGGRVALGGVAPVPVRVPEAEAVLAEGGQAGPDLFRRCAAAAAAAIDPPGDGNGSADYRRALTQTLIEDACAKAVSR